MRDGRKGSEGEVLFLSLEQDVVDGVLVGVQRVAEAPGPAEDGAGVSSDGRVFRGRWVVEERVLDTQGALRPRADTRVPACWTGAPAAMTSARRLLCGATLTVGVALESVAHADPGKVEWSEDWPRVKWCAYSPTTSSSASTGCCGVYPSVRST